MNKILLSLGILGVILLATISLFYPTITGLTIEQKYSFTRAICNETNYCQDYYISCKDTTITHIAPITGAAVQFSENWVDNRSEKSVSELCS